MEFNMFDLFENVDASQVPIQEASPVRVERIQALTLAKIKPRRQMAPRVFLAAAIAATLTVSALAYAGFSNYSDSDGMLDDAYGNQQQNSVVSATGPYGPVPDSQRVPLDPEAADLAAPYIASVERTIRDGNLSVTVHGHLYDSVTGCGVIYYTAEDPAGFDYQLQYDGMISSLPVVLKNTHGYSFLLEDKSTDTRLEIMEYYIHSPWYPENHIQVVLHSSEDPVSEEEKFAREQNSLKLPFRDGGGMEGRVGSGIRLSPIGITLEASQMDFLGDSKNLDTLERLALRFQDGSEFVIEDDTSNNYMFAASPEEGHLVIPFNRLVDLNQVQAVVVDSHEITDLQPIQEDQRWRPEEYLEQKSELDTPASAGSGAITFQGMTFTPGTLRYDPITRAGQLPCTLTTQDSTAQLLTDGHFSPYKAGIQMNHPGQWKITAQEDKKLEFVYYFVAFENESDFLKFWFEGSNADPRLDQATENLICLPFSQEPGVVLELAEGNIKVTELGMFLDYKALDIDQGSRPKDLSIQFTDGSQRIISSWDEDILDGCWLNTREVRGTETPVLQIGFYAPVEVGKIQSVTYAGQVFMR